MPVSSAIKTIAVIAVFLACAVPGLSAPKTFTVPDDYKDIQKAIEAASAGDTVLISPGTFEISKPLDLSAGVTLTGSGADKTILSGTAVLKASQDPEKGSIIVARDQTTIKNLQLRHAGMCGIYIRGLSGEVRNAAVERTIIWDCPAGGIVFNNQFNTAGILLCAFNTIVGCGAGIADNDWNTVNMFNNIIASCKIGVQKFNVVTWIAEYNDVFDCSGGNWVGMTAGANNISSDPLFKYAATGGFSLLPKSPCIDTGTPDPAYQDPDGSRSDMGAL